MAGTATATISLALSAGTGTVADAGTHANRPLITDSATGALVLNATEFADAFRIGGAAAGTFSQAGAAVIFTAADGHTADALTHRVTFTGDGAGGYVYAFRVEPAGTASGANATLAAALTDGRYLVQAVTQDANGAVVQAPAQQLIVDTTADAGAPATLVVNDTADHVVTPVEATSVAFTVTGLDGDATAIATFTDGAHSRSAPVTANGIYSVDLAGFAGRVQSSLTITDVHQNTASVSGNTVLMAAGAGAGAAGAGADPAHQSLFGTLEHSTASGAAGVYALYAALLGRAPDPLGLETFAGQALTTVAQALLAAPERGAGVQSTAAFVQGLYANLLHRQADASGLATFTNELNAGVSQAQVAVQLATSPEAQSAIAPAFQAGVFVPSGTDAGVARLYYGLLDRAPDAGGLSHFSDLINANILANRIAGSGPNWAQSLALVADRILASPEYTTTHGALSDAAYVDSLYIGALGRHAEPAGASVYADQLAHGTSRATVALEIAQSPEVQVHLVGVIEQGFHLTG